MIAPLFLALLQLPVPAPTPSATPPECTAQQAFGVRFGASVDDYAPTQPRPARSGGRFVSYRVRTKFESAKYDFYTVEADLRTREVYSVRAWSRIDDVPPEPDYDRLFVPAIRQKTGEFASANGISISTEGRPPYSVEQGGVDYTVWHDFFAGTLHYTFDCTNKQVERAVQKRVLQDLNAIP